MLAMAFVALCGFQRFEAPVDPKTWIALSCVSPSDFPKISA